MSYLLRKGLSLLCLSYIISSTISEQRIHDTITMGEQKYSIETFLLNEDRQDILSIIARARVEFQF
jgi:hypothetical protein